MYGGLNGEASTQRNGAVSAAATYNETSSTIKGELDTWYKNNISGKTFEFQIADNLFCNDRQFANEVGGGATGPGYGNEDIQTHYAARYRLITTTIPTLKCGLKNDSFTTDIDTTLGNGALTFPIALLTADEALMAGLVYNTSNTTNYLYTNQNQWCISPSIFYVDGSARVWDIHFTGNVETVTVTNSLGVRPVIPISSNIEVSGTGSATDPFIAI